MLRNINFSGLALIAVAYLGAIGLGAVMRVEPLRHALFG